MQWKLQDAKNRLSFVVQRATDEGPQIINVRGKPTAIVMSIEEYHRLTQPKSSLTGFFRDSPLRDQELEIKRSKEHPREVDL